MKKLLLFVVIVLPFFTTAQSLSGSYVIGSTQPFPFNSITNAVAKINTSGVSGPVVFLLDNANFDNATGEVFPIKISQFPGSSAVNTLTIKPNAGKNVTVTALNINNWTSVPAVFQVDGADNIIINGSNSAAGTTQNLTVINNDEVVYGARSAIWISSNSANGATNITIVNTKLKFLNRNAEYLQLSGIFCGSNSVTGSNAISGTNATASNSNIVVNNNEFINVRQGFVVRGSETTSLRSSNIQFSGNKLGSTVATEKPSTPLDFLNVTTINITDNSIIGVANNSSSDVNLGVVLENATNCIFKRNILQDFKTDGIFAGRILWIKGNTINMEISENKISKARNNVNGQIYGLHLDVNPTSSGILIVNNFISDVASSIASEYTDSAYGIYSKAGAGTRILYNTIALNSPDNGKSAALHIEGGSAYDIRNNILSNTSGTGQQRFAIFANVAASAFTTINYNDYYAPNIGSLAGSTKVTLQNWKDATLKDQNSVNVLPNFTSIADLHLPGANNTVLDNKGQFIAGFTTDIDGQPRSATTPDMGADEFSVPIPLATEPSTSATAITFTNVTSGGFKVNWTNGNGAARIVLIRSGSAVNAIPIDATTYTSSTVFGSGSQIGTGNYVIFAGSQNTVSVTGLSPATTYFVSVFEYNGSAATTNYRTISPLTGSATTINADLGWPITNIDAVNKITFDTNLTGVNSGQFLGSGIAVTPISGQLDSNAWSAAGFEAGAVGFGGINTNPGFGRGVSSGGVNAGGIYAFMTSGNNAALGIQPSSTDFTPGAVTLRFQNKTGAPITSFSIGYKVFVFNDQPGASSFNFSHSADNATFTGISQLDVTSPAAADGAATWKASYRVATITGLNIPANGYYYIKWSGAVVTPSSDYDEFAIDDIALSANPNTNFVAFDGIAENFSIHGNTSLSANTTVQGELKFTAGKLAINGNTLTIGGNVINTVSGAIKGSATSNISINGTGDKILSFDQTTPGTTNLINNLNLLFSASKTVTLANPVVINGNLTVALDQTLNVGTNALTGNLNAITVNGNLRTQNISALPVPSGKTFAGSGTVVYDAAANQKLVAGTYNNLTLSSPAGTIASGAITVNGVLNLPQTNPTNTIGSLALGTNILTMGANATNVGQGDVSGITTRNTILPNVVYTFGNPNTSILFPNVGTLPTSLSLKTTIGVAPSWMPGAINRTYDFIQSGAAATKAVLRAHYLDSELNGNNESRLVDFAHIYSSGATIDQGRSNFDADENWIELTNVNIGLYFTNVFGDVSLTLDETISFFATWNGSQSNSWTTAENWTPTGTPSDDTAVLIPDASTTLNDPTINPLNLLGSITIAQGGIVNAPVGSQLTIKGGAGAWINYGTFNAGSGSNRVIFTNIDATIAGTTNFNNVTINTGAGLRPLAGNIMRIGGELKINGNFAAGALENTVEFNGTNQVVPVPTGLAASYHNLVLNGANTIIPTTLGIAGDLTINQPVNFAGKTVLMGGSDPQMIAGSITPQFGNLTVNNSNGGVLLSTNVNVNETLNLQSGIFKIADFNLTLGVNPVSGTFGAGNMIVADQAGFVRRPYSSSGSYLFPIGEMTGVTSYSPISVNVTAGSFVNAFVNVSVVDAVHPNNYSSQNNISRFWNVSQTGITNAIATITASYLNADILSSEASISAAQLSGVFNQQSNPWQRFAPLSSFTLTATDAMLQPGVVSYFTGIKGAGFSASIAGGGTYCENEPVTLLPQINGGDLPFQYTWSSGLGTEATANPPVTNVGTANYTLTVKDANGIQATSSVDVTTIAAPIAGTISANQTVCFSYGPNPITVTGNTAPVIYWQRSDNPSFSNPITINSTSNVLSSAEAGEIVGQTYFRAAIANGTCATVFTAPAIMDTRTTTWNGVSWSNGSPDSVTSAVIAADYTLSANFNACSLTIVNNAQVLVSDGFDVTLNGHLAVQTGSFTLQNDTNLIQLMPEVNFGDIEVKRKSSALFRLDYTMWGSPLYGQQKLLDFSPLTLTNRFYTLDPLTNAFQTTNPTLNGFTPGAGYLIRMPNNHVAFTSTATPLPWTGSFIGVPTNGPVSVPINVNAQRITMLANPYASMVDADLFLDANASEIDGTLYFWRRRNNLDTTNELNSAYYATYTAAGGTRVIATEQPFTSAIPNGYIQVGQGFLVRTIATPTNAAVSFTNGMRTSQNNDNQFFKTASAPERSRIWLNVTTASGEFGQTLIAYLPGASNNVDRTDGKYFNDGSMAISSWLDNSEYIIQGRAPFVSSDVVLLNFKTPIAGTYTISIDQLDGIFADDQNVYLRDKANNTEIDLKNNSYSFTTGPGSFNDRFEVFYENFLGTDPSNPSTQNVVVYKEQSDIRINTGNEIMDAVQVYDLSGRLLFQNKKVNASDFRCNVGSIQQVLVVKVKVAGQSISRKIVN